MATHSPARGCFSACFGSNDEGMRLTEQEKDDVLPSKELLARARTAIVATIAIRRLGDDALNAEFLYEL